MIFTYAGLPSTSMLKEQEIPLKLSTNKGNICIIHFKSISLIYNSSDFTELRAHYHTILHLMPNDYELTVGKLQNYFSDDQICDVLLCSNSTDANKLILDHLIQVMSCREELLDFCDQLELIAESHDLKVIINGIRSG